MTSPPPTCDHCALPCHPILIADEVNGERRNFCCHGCQGAYRIITGAGLGQFYRRRSWQEQGVPEAVFQTAYQDEYLTPFLRQTTDGTEISLLVEGIRCATCVWLIERILVSQPGVRSARVNFGTHRLRLVFDPEETRASRLLQSLSHIGYLCRPFTRQAAAQQTLAAQRGLLIRFGTAAFLSMQLMGFSLALYAGYFQGIEPQSRQLMQLFAALVTTPVVFYCGWPFLAGAWQATRSRLPNMDLLISLGVLVTYGYSLWAMLAGGEVYFDTAAMIVTLILLGRLLETMARGMAGGGIDRLLRLSPDLATRLTADGTESVASSALVVGDRIQVAPGQRFPVDGTIARGTTEVDESIVSGEARPVPRQRGMTVLAGALNLSGGVEVNVTRLATDSFVARVARLVEEAQSRKAPIQSLADRLAVLFVPMIMAVAVLTVLSWLLAGHDLSRAIINGVAVLVVACPCALGLATPTAVLVATGRAAARGILFRGGDILEATARIQTAAFDKTGTLTIGRPEVTGVLPASGSAEINDHGAGTTATRYPSTGKRLQGAPAGVSPARLPALKRPASYTGVCEQAADTADGVPCDRLRAEGLLSLAASLEQVSSHPLAQAIVREARAKGLSVTPGVAQVVPGQGLFLESEQGCVRVGTRDFLTEHGINVPASSPSSQTEVHLAVGARYQGLILLNDTIRPEAGPVIAELKRLGIGLIMLTGDHPAAARRIADPLGIDFLAGLTPERKAAWVKTAQEGGRTVLMVGDGINDAPALSAANVGCAMAGGTDIALDTADLALTPADLGKLLEAIRLARQAIRVIRQNLFWAFFYNILMLPLAACGQVTPIHAAAAMAMSSVCVVGNSLRLRGGREA